MGNLVPYVHVLFETSSVCVTRASWEGAQNNHRTSWQASCCTIYIQMFAVFFLAICQSLALGKSMGSNSLSSDVKPRASMPFTFHFLLWHALTGCSTFTTCSTWYSACWHLQRTLSQFEKVNHWLKSPVPSSASTHRVSENDTSLLCTKNERFWWKALSPLW